MDDILKVMPEQNQVDIKVSDIREKFTFDKDSIICLFMNSAINLKTEINAIEEQFKCKVNGTEFNPSNIKYGILEPHAFVMMASCKMFIDWYTENYDDTVYKHVEQYIFERRSELFFSGLKVETEGQDYVKLRQIIDALCARFYQEIIMALTQGFAIKHQAFIMKANEAQDGYTFKFRNYNLMELDQFRQQGLIPINVQD